MPPQLTQQFTPGNYQFDFTPGNYLFDFTPGNYLFDFKHADFALIKAELNTINWIDLLHSCPDINSTWNTFSATLYAAIYRHCPRHKATNSPKRSLPRNTLTLIYCKNAAWRRLKSCCTQLTKTTYKNLTNITRNAIRAFYRSQELKVLGSNNPKFFFAYVNSRLNPRPCSPHLLDPSKVDSTCSNPLSVANIFTISFKISLYPSMLPCLM